MHIRIFFVFLFTIIFPFNIFSQQYDKYIWETHTTSNLSSEADELINRLREEVDKILEKGHLAPLRAHYNDVTYEGYYFYQEPGRIITTLAMAYPYLTESQKQAVKTYVNNELSNPSYTPWASNKNLPPGEGSRREYFVMTSTYYCFMCKSGDWVFSPWDWWWGIYGTAKPRIHTLYGLWLYAYNSGDWGVISNNWSAIKNFYNSNSGQGNIYGTMCAHIAMARMAFKMGDTAMMNTAVTNANNSFTAGLNFNNTETAAQSYYTLRYSRCRGWMFINTTPEVGRYLKEADTNLRTAVLNRIKEIKGYNLWWIYRAQYGGWTGNECVGLTSEIIGMVFPIERWVAGATKETLRSYMIENACDGIGDCYVIEGIIYTISSYGTDSWIDIRTTPVLSVDPLTLDFTEIKPGETKTLSFTISNNGGGTLSGTISSNRDWIIPDKSEFNENNITVNVTVNGKILNQKQGEYSGNIEVNSNAGSATIEVKVTATCVLIKPNPYNPCNGQLTFFGDGIVEDNIEIKIWTVSGTLIRTLKNLTIWDGKDDKGDRVTDGIYIFTYQTSKEKGAGKVTVLKK